MHRHLLRATAVAALSLALLGGHGAAAATCAGRQGNDGICGNRELMALHQAGEATLKQLVAAADPLTALLLRRDQRWSMEVVAGRDGGSFDPQNQAEYMRKKSALEVRNAELDRLVAGAAPEGVTGEWLNAFGNAKIDKHGDSLAIEISAGADYGDGEPLECKLKAELSLRPDGWYAGTPASGTERDTWPEANKVELRLRLQGNTLRVVLIDNFDASPCEGPAMITGSYFLRGKGAARPGNAAARTVSPSFDCATAKNADEEEICADPELAALDAEIARTYRDTLRRLDPKLAAELRADQRGWSNGNTGAFDIFLHPFWDKRHYFVAQTGNVRIEWRMRMRERLAMLANLDERRQGLAGHWVSYNAMLSILPAEGETDGTIAVEGGKWVTGSQKAYCEFDGDGRVAGRRFRFEASQNAPKLRREGATLTVDSGDPDPDRHGEVNRKPPEYCSRLASAKARLFPVKPAGYLGHVDDRIR